MHNTAPLVILKNEINLELLRQGVVDKTEVAWSSRPLLAK